MANLKTVIYARVSTNNQSTDNQIPVLTEWALNRGWELTGTYRENESAWKAGHQTEWARLIADARRSKFSRVIVWALDRVCRQGATETLIIVKTLHQYNVDLISYQEPFTEMPGEVTELMFAWFGWVAKMESVRRSERTKAGQARARREGKVIGRPKGRKDKKKRNKRRCITP